MNRKKYVKSKLRVQLALNIKMLLLNEPIMQQFENSLLANYQILKNFTCSTKHVCLLYELSIRPKSKQFSIINENRYVIEFIFLTDNEIKKNKI